MSLCCTETNRVIYYHEALFAGTRVDVDGFHALSQDVINRIPVSERFFTPRSSFEDGLDIHKATSDLNWNGTYTWLEGFTLGEFLFSISQETAEKYLPNHIHKYR